jgi:hypothetical protein
MRKARLKEFSMKQFGVTYVVPVAVLTSLSILFLAAGRMAGQATDPFVGTWKLNVAKSTFTPGPAPKSETIRVEPAGEGHKVTGETVLADGKTGRIEYVAANDGKDYPVQGSPTTDAVSARRIDTRTTELEYKKGGKTVRTLRARVSPDGKTMTLSVKGMNAQGEAVTHNVVYQKQ